VKPQQHHTSFDTQQSTQMTTVMNNGLNHSSRSSTAHTQQSSLEKRGEGGEALFLSFFLSFFLFFFFFWRNGRIQLMTQRICWSGSPRRESRTKKSRETTFVSISEARSCDKEDICGQESKDARHGYCFHENISSGGGNCRDWPQPVIVPRTRLTQSL
jgi:hypothetical protein